MPAVATRWLSMSVAAAARMFIAAKNVNDAIGFPGVIGLGVNGFPPLLQSSSTVRPGAGTEDS